MCRLDKKEQIAVAATQEGEVLAMFAGNGLAFSWSTTPERARWLARELMSAADRVEGYVSHERLCKGALGDELGVAQ